MDSLQSPSANAGPVLGYGTVRQRRWWRIVALLALVVLVPPGFWWSRSMLQKWSEDRSRRAEIRYEVTTNLADASARTKDEQWANAQIAIDRAQLASEADASLFSDRELQGFGQRISEAEAELRAAQERAVLQPGDVVWRRPSPRDPRDASTICTKNIADLNRTADQLLQEGRYAEALQTLRQVLILDPNNAHAQARFQDALLERPSSDDTSDDE